MSIVSDIKKWATEKVSVWSLVILTLICTALSVNGIICLVKDVQASYHGWGKLLVSFIDMPNSEWFGWVLAIVPSLFTMAYFTSRIVGFQTLTDHKVFNFISITSMIVDNLLDIISLTVWGANVLVSVFSATTVALVFFTGFSEIAISLFLPITITLWSVLLSRAFANQNWSLTPEEFGPTPPSATKQAQHAQPVQVQR